jgi:hypothetical protein
MAMSDLRLSAYYYSFTATGIREIDEILSAVACAGKAYHHTDNWQEDTSKYQDHLEGDSPEDWIQNAANRAALYLRAAQEDDD